MLLPVPARKEVLRIEGRDVPISNPEKIFFPQRGYTKLDVVRYFLAVSEGALRGAGVADAGAGRFIGWKFDLANAAGSRQFRSRQAFQGQQGHGRRCGRSLSSV